MGGTTCRMSLRPPPLATLEFYSGGHPDCHTQVLDASYGRDVLAHRLVKPLDE